MQDSKNGIKGKRKNGFNIWAHSFASIWAEQHGWNQCLDSFLSLMSE
jgi:hypothetical protein